MSALVAVLVGALTFAAALIMLNTRRRAALTRKLGYFVDSSRTDSKRRLTLDGPVADRLDGLLVALGVQRRLSLALERAAIDGGAGPFSALVLLVTGAVFVLSLIVAGLTLAVVAALAAPMVAAAVVAVLGQRRVRAFETQLPEILDTLSASLRAGHGFDHALQNLSEDVAEPGSREFKRVIAEVHLGRSMDAALTDLGERINSKDLLFVLDAINVQRQVGGSLAELFVLVAYTVREREKFRRNLRAITGMPRMSARVLTLLPAAAALLLSLVNHAYMAPLFTTRAGHVMLAITVLMILVGGVILRRIGSVNPS
ncbi:MAG TPA: type II secretion system F family protein [Gaiellaceae bacterium]|nr:type II secretion system F family protein [Gaiellaceae bacterium]